MNTDLYVAKTVDELAQVAQEIKDEELRQTRARLMCFIREREEFLRQRCSTTLAEVKHLIPPALVPYLSAADVPRWQAHSPDQYGIENYKDDHQSWYCTRWAVAVPGWADILIHLGEQYVPATSAEGPRYEWYISELYVASGGRRILVGDWANAISSAASFFPTKVVQESAPKDQTVPSFGNRRMRRVVMTGAFIAFIWIVIVWALYRF